MRAKIYYEDFKEALKDSKLYKFACYIDKRTGTKCWISEGEIIFFEDVIR